MKSVKDLFSGHSSDYARFRPVYPEELYRIILSMTPSAQMAWDAGTGNGQVAVQLARYFDQVTGTDISQNQLDQAPLRPNIEWKVARSEQSGLPGDSVDLITVGQALHWFDIEAFRNEVRRVLKTEGILACFGYGLIKGPPAVNPALEELYEGILGEYWPPERKWIENKYEGIGIPFLHAWELNAEVTWGRDALTGYLSTWSAVKAYIAATGRDPLREFSKNLLLPRPARFQFPVFLKIWRPAENL